MNLAFSTTFPKKAGDLYETPTHFGNKILIGIHKHIGTMNIDSFKIEYAKMMAKHGIEAPPVNFNAKIHTIRRDLSKRWKKGRDIHFVMFQRSKDQFQFAPVLKCTETQQISIKHYEHEEEQTRCSVVFIDGKEIGKMIFDNTTRSEPKIVGSEIKDLAINDGFDSVEHFFQYFNEDFQGTLIHWTGVRYGTETIKDLEVTAEVVGRKCDCFMNANEPGRICKCESPEDALVRMNSGKR